MEISTRHVATSELEPWHELRGKIVMVTGASSGLGWEFCIDLAKAGCRIIAAARRTDRLKTLCDKINYLDIYSQLNPSATRNDGVHAMAVELDITGEGPSIQAGVQKAWDAFGGIDVLINNAGITGPLRSVLDLSEEDYDRTFKTNVRGSWLVSKYVCLQMLASDRRGSVINISSIYGHTRPHPRGSVAYSTSKSSINAMTKVMAMELGKHKIRVNSICPGLFKSEITENLVEKKWVKNFVSRMVPMGDLGNINPALTSLLRYLIHDSSDYVTGNVFIVDSGSDLPGVPLYSSL